jgi:hypothetical protein
MSERPTQTLQTPEGRELVLKTYINAREFNEIKKSFLSAVKIDLAAATSEKAAQEAISAAAQQISLADISEANEYAAIRAIAQSYDGSPENIVERLLDASPEEYNFASREVQKVQTGGFKTAK